MVRELRSLPVERLKLLVFDLDGTLIDSAQDLCNSVNATLIHFGREPLEDAIIAGMIGEGALTLVRRAFTKADGAPVSYPGDKDPSPGTPVSHPGDKDPSPGTPVSHPGDKDPSPGTPVKEDLLGRAHAWFLDYYREHKLDFTYAYEGVLEALAALRALRDQPCCTGRAMAVLTNKPVRPARDICDALGLAPYFLRIYGGNSFSTKKPDPEGLLALMVEAGARPEETVMIGDSKVDVLTARNAGAWSIGCTFGLAPESLAAIQPDVMVDSPADWTEALSPAKIG